VSIVVRPTAPDELRAAATVMRAALLFPPPSDEDWAESEASWSECDSVSAWDGDRCVGHAGSFHLDTTVPGGSRLDTAGVTRIGVLPTHTRQGALRDMMTLLLDRAREHGKVLASLRASEATIYGRFGFAVAGRAAAAQIDGRRARPVHRSSEGTMRVITADEAAATLPDLYDRCARHRVGTVSRTAGMWHRSLEDVVKGKKAAFVAVHEDSTGTADGFVRYEVAWSAIDDMFELGQGTIDDLWGASPAIERALWAYLLDLDLVTSWRAWWRPLDDVVIAAAADPRGYRVDGVADEQWVRLLDVDVAFGSRSYGPTDRAVNIQVHDPVYSSNCGTWRIDSYGAFRSHADPDLMVDVAEASAAYLGGTSWRELADAGRVVVRRADAVADADALFATRPVPFCGTFF
jgi:predicted acetyltransferase